MATQYASENNPKANGEAFANGWFRTGDQGVMDAEGYVTITGRLKAIINRGGEKDLREFAAKRLADFKVPRKILILPEIPKGATGKVQRIGLAQKLGLTEPAS